VGKHPQETSIFDYIVPVVSILAAFLGFGWAIYAFYNSPLRKERAERKWFIITLKKVVDELTAHLEWEQNSGFSSKQFDAAYRSSWVDLGLATPGNEGWQYRLETNEARWLFLTESEWEKFVSLVRKFGRVENNGSIVVWLNQSHADGSISIEPWDNNRKSVNPDSVAALV